MLSGLALAWMHDTPRRRVLTAVPLRFHADAAQLMELEVVLGQLRWTELREHQRKHEVTTTQQCDKSNGSRISSWEIPFARDCSAVLALGLSNGVETTGDSPAGPWEPVQRYTNTIQTAAKPIGGNQTACLHRIKPYNDANPGINAVYTQNDCNTSNNPRRSASIEKRSLMAENCFGVKQANTLKFIGTVFILISRLRLQHVIVNCLT